MFQVYCDGRSAVVVPFGDVDLATAGRLRDLLDVASSLDCDQVVVDAGHITFMDSQGLNALARAHRELRRTCRQLVIRNPTPHVARVIRLLGLDQVLVLDSVALPVQRVS